MKNKLIPSILTLMCLTLSCSDITEETAESFLEEDNSFETANDATSSINAVYDRLRTVYRQMTNLADVSGEEMEVNPFSAEQYDIDRNQHTAANTIFDDFYTNSYLLIDRANRVIANVPSIAMDAKLRDQIVGEGKFLRALAYFNLVRAFGDVPLITTASSSVTDVAKARDGLDSVYQQIMKDLTEAESVLPLKYTASKEIGRATIGAAKSILAKVYLTRKEYDNAAAKALEVINSNQYSLFANYKDVFLPEKKNGAEHIFSVQYSCILNTYGSPMTNDFAIMFSYPINRSGGFKYVTQYHITTYLPTDSRKAINFIYEKQNPTTKEIVKPTVDAGPATDKFWDPLACGASQARNNYMVIRYADVLLMYAEAVNELSGPTAEAYDAINQVRKRARNGVISADPQDLAGLTKDEFRDAVLQERSWELCFEGHRRWDLLRTGKYIEVLTKAGVPVADKNLLYPIPQNEITVNPLLKQNTGY